MATMKMEAICSSEMSVHTRFISAIFQKTAFFIATGMKTSDPTQGLHWFAVRLFSQSAILITIYEVGSRAGLQDVIPKEAFSLD
jgi:uncharacterized membrane protein